MEENAFVQWWNNLFAGIGYWFTSPEAGGGISNLSRIIIAILLAVAGHYLIKLIMIIIRKIFGVKKGIRVDISVKSFTISTINILLHVGLFLLILMTLNVNFTSVAAILSAGTVAVGLALQNIIASFVSGIILLYTKYFKSGDYIGLVHADGSCEGHIKTVNVLTTTLRTYDGYEVTIPNDKMIKGVITNYTREANRRVVIEFKVDYNADIDRLKEVIYKVINGDKRVVYSPAPFVNVVSLDEFGVTIAAKCWVPFEVYWDAKFAISEKIILALRDNEFKIPYHSIRLIPDGEKKPVVD